MARLLDATGRLEPQMADKTQCEAALRTLADRLDKHAGAGGTRPRTPDRTIVCRIPDIDTCFSAALRSGSLTDVVEGNRRDAQITFTVNSDDLVAVTDGSLSFVTAWTSGRLKIDASLRDLLRVRSLL
jgi:hypothetical protein